MWSVAPLLPQGRNAAQFDRSLLLVASTPQMQQCLTHPARSAEWGHQSLQTKDKEGVVMSQF